MSNEGGVFISFGYIQQKTHKYVLRMFAIFVVTVVTMFRIPILDMVVR